MCNYWSGECSFRLLLTFRSAQIRSKVKETKETRWRSSEDFSWTLLQSYWEFFHCQHPLFLLLSLSKCMKIRKARHKHQPTWVRVHSPTVIMLPMKYPTVNSKLSHLPRCQKTGLQLAIRPLWPHHPYSICTSTWLHLATTLYMFWKYYKWLL